MEFAYLNSIRMSGLLKMRTQKTYQFEGVGWVSFLILIAFIDYETPVSFDGVGL